MKGIKTEVEPETKREKWRQRDGSLKEYLM